MINPDIAEEFLSKYELKKYEKLLKKFFYYEYYFLSNNESLNPLKFKENSRISINSFDNYFGFPMIVNRCLFRAIDEKELDCISAVDYVESFMKIYTGDINQRINFIFNFFSLNSDNLVHKIDVSFLLNYQHVFFDKKNQDLLKAIIQDFFEDNSTFTLNKFIYTLTNKNSDIFFLVMCMFFENENFNTDLLEILEEEAASIDLPQKPVKKLSPKRREKSPPKNQEISLKDISDLAIPSEKVKEYILTNYEISLLEVEKEKSKNFCLIDETSLKEDIEDDQHQELLELDMFEKNMLETKEFYIDKIKEYALQELQKTDSDTAALNDGVFVSNFTNKVKNTLFASTKSFLYFPGCLKGTNIVSHHGGTHFKSTGSILQVGSIKSNPGSGHELTESGSVNNESQKEVIFDEEILFRYNSKKTNQLKSKKYTLVLVKKYLLILKKKKGNTLSVIENESNVSKLKKMIPLKHLFVSGVEEGIVLNQTIYNKLNLVSTIKMKMEEYCFLFENLKRLNKLVKLIYEETNFVSIPSEYIFLKDIGQGGFSQIKLMNHKKSKKSFSIKKLRKTVEKEEDFVSLNWEKDIVKLLINFPELENIVKFYKIIESAHHIYIVMEYVETGTIGNYLVKNDTCLKSSSVKEIIMQIFNALRRLHEYGIIHRDLKLENVLVDFNEDKSFNMKLIDFGLSQVVSPLGKTKEAYGTLFYCSPEILLRIPYSFKVDVWSAGVLAYYLEYTKMPFGIKGREPM